MPNLPRSPKATAERELRITPIGEPAHRHSGGAYKVGTAMVTVSDIAPNAIRIDCFDCQSSECEHANALRRAVLIGTARATVGT